MSRPKPGAESAMRRGFPDAVQKKILIIYGAIFGVGVLYAFLILHTPFRIPCLFREVTGLQCPGCGTSRMALALMRFDIPAVLLQRPLWGLRKILWLFSASPHGSSSALQDFSDIRKSCEIQRSFCGSFTSISWSIWFLRFFEICHFLVKSSSSR